LYILETVIVNVLGSKIESYDNYDILIVAFICAVAVGTGLPSALSKGKGGEKTNHILILLTT